MWQPVTVFPNPARKRATDFGRLRDVWDRSLAHASGYERHDSSYLGDVIPQKVG